MIRRYILFGGDNFYAEGGMHDFIESKDTLQELLLMVKQLQAKDAGAMDWWHVYDSSLRRCVAASDSQAYGAPDEVPKMESVIGS